jgi:hypothetical protein
MCSSTCASSQPEPLTIHHPLAPPVQLKEKIKTGTKKKEKTTGKANKKQDLVAPESPAMCTRSKTPESPAMGTRSKRKILE